MSYPYRCGETPAATDSGEDHTTDTPSTPASPGRAVTSDDTPHHRDIGADYPPVTEDDPDTDWELMQDEGRWPSWL